MESIIFITPKDVEYGFSLAGIRQIVVGVGEAEDELKRVLSKTDTGIVVIDERLLKGIDEKKLRDIEKKWYGIFLILPAPKKEAGLEDYALRLIKRVIGYHVRLEK